MENTSTTGKEAFETIASIDENLGRRGAGATWTRDTLRSGNNYLKSVYKSHLGPEEPCANHCNVFFFFFFFFFNLIFIFIFNFYNTYYLRHLQY